MPFFSHLGILCRMVKIEHSIFALPFAFLGAFAAAKGMPEIKTLIFLSLAMVCVRSFAMTFNRIVDVEYDKLNPRTATRPLVTGEIKAFEAWIFCGLMGVGFILVAANINELCLILSPLALAIAAFYSYTKRFTWLCHFVLGLVLAMAPMAGWLSVIDKFSLPPILITFGVLFWVAGFDILYACQDLDFDRKYGLHSVPTRFGIPTSLAIAGFCHVNTVFLLFLGGWGMDLGWIWYLVCFAVSLLLILEHRLVKPDDLSKINLAFFIINGTISIFLFLGILAAIFI